MVFAPKYTKVRPENIPQPLKNEKRWTVWKSVDRHDGKKPGKVPCYNHYNEQTGDYEERPANIHNPNHLMTFDEAYKMLAAKKSPFSGMQYALDFNKELEDEDRLIGVDLDDVLTPEGDIKPEILDIIRMFNSYTEFSPSRAGIRIFCYGKFSLNAGVKSGNFEIYQCDKLLTVTGDRIITTPETINEAQAAIDAFREKHFKEVDQIDESKLPVTDVKFTDDQLKEKIRNSEKGRLFEKLHNKRAEPEDDLSAVDYAYCMTLVKFTQDEAQIDRLYRSSALMREKWDRPDGRDKTGPITYGLRTIRKAIRYRGTDVYTSSSEKTSLADLENYNLDMYPFRVTPQGIFKKEISKYSGEAYEVNIASTPVVIVAIGEIIDDTRIMFTLKIRTVKGKDIYVWKPFESLLNRKDVLALQKDGLQIKESKVNELIDYFDKFITVKKNELDSNQVASSCGWTSNNNSFILGTSRITPDSITEIFQLDTETAGLFACKGHKAEWARNASKLLDYPAVRYKAYVSCVPPLLKLLYFTPYILFQDLPTGKAKTTSNWLAASIWGNPIEQQTGGNSTPKGIENFIQYIKGLPSFLDETTQKPEVAKELVYAVGNLTRRRKSTTDNTGGVITSGTPETVLIMTGEVPIIDEKGRGGQDMRAQPLSEGVSDFIPNLDSIAIGLRENYGHVSRLYIQKLFAYKNHLRDIYNGFLENLPEVEGIQENRVKAQYAIAATAGFILEQVFAEIVDENGEPYIKPANPLEICKRYMEQNVVNKPFVEDYIKALRCAYQFFTTNQIYFMEEENLNHTEYGWIREARGTKELLICFDEAILAKYIDKELGTGRYAAAVKEWQEKGIINVRTINDKDKKGKERTRIIKTVQIKVRSASTTVLQIPLNKFYEHLHINPDDSQDSSGNKPSDNPSGNGQGEGSNYDNNETAIPEPLPEPEIKTSVISANVPPSSGSGLNQVTSVTATLNNIVVADSSTNLHDLIMNSLSRDDR